MWVLEGYLAIKQVNSDRYVYPVIIYKKLWDDIILKNPPVTANDWTIDTSQNRNYKYCEYTASICLLVLLQNSKNKLK